MRKRRRAKITRPKTRSEIENTERAITIVGKVLTGMSSPFGRQERDVASEIRRRIYAEGATLAFRPIVASGRNASHVHHRPGRKIVREDELVIFDIGAKCGGCCSDITRMHVPDNKRARKLHADAMNIQRSLIRKAKRGMEFKELQDIYKRLMRKNGYKVKHLIGHGIGERVHERVKGGLEAGMILAIEPGIYVKNYGGCRVEDMILVRKGEPRVMSAAIRLPRAPTAFPGCPLPRPRVRLCAL